MVFNSFFECYNSCEGYYSLNNGCQGHMEREVAIYSEKKVPGESDVPLLHTSKMINLKKS